MCRLRIAAAAAVLAGTLATAAFAHVATSEAIREADRRIAADPGNAALYLERGELHRARGDTASAFADFDRAAAAAPDLAEVELHRGRLLLDLGRLEPARASLERFLACSPDDVEGVIQHARLLVARGEPLLGAARYARAIALAAARGRPSPDLFVARARALLAAGSLHRGEAVAALDDGYRRLGAVALALLALDQVIEAGAWDDALARIDHLAFGAARPESWLYRRGEVLARAGRGEQAAPAFAAALEAITGLPPARRETRAVRELEGKIRAAQAGLRGRVR